MNLNIKPYLFIIGLIALVFIAIAILRNAMPARSPEQWDKQYGHMIKPIVFGLFFLSGLMLVPVCLKLFIAMQEKGGNNDISRLLWVKEHVKEIMYTVWTVFVIGLCAALPYMIQDGFFRNDEPVQTAIK